MPDFEEINEFMEEENVKFIRLTFFDAFGKQKNIAIMPQELSRALTEGISFDGTAVRGFSSDVRSDLFLKPDLSTVSIVPWRPIDGRVTRMFCNVVRPDGSAHPCDSRHILRKAMREAKKMGIHVYFGPEVEFYVFKQDDNGNPTREPLDHAGYMDVDPEDKGDNIRREICFTLLDMGITPEASHHEQGPGQNEVDFKYGDPMTTADNTATFKWAVKSIAESNGTWADFSPKPLQHQPGNGMHINISVRSDDGLDHLNEFMAGVLHYVRDMTLFLNPMRGSYDRLGRQEAPRYISWSAENRSQLIRIPASSAPTKRMELRSPDPMANQYLAFALIIYAGLEGIKNSMDPGSPVEANLYQAGSDVTGQLSHLPERIEEAIQCAKDSEFIREHLPQQIIDAYCDITRVDEEG